MLSTINDRAAVIYMDAKSVQMDRNGKLEGSLWTCEKLMNISLDDEIDELKLKIEQQEEDARLLDAENRQKEKDKKPEDAIFRELLFKEDNIDNLHK